jgi:hypothetical protein
VVLLLALVALLLIAAVGAAIIFMASSESAIVGAQKVSTRSFYASSGGLEEGRYRLMVSIPNALGGINAADTAGFARVPALPAPLNPVIGPSAPPTEVLYIVNIPNPSAPANFDAAGSLAAVMAEDEFLAAEVPAAVTFRGVASIQPNAGDPNRSVLYEWIRINLKTELAAQQDLNFDGVLDEDPIFLFMGRQYRASDLLVYDFDGLGAGNPGDMLPPPWGPDPLAQAPPILDRPCVAVICATPVYMLTSRAEVPLPGSPPTSRLIRTEVAVPFAFSIDAGILSEAGIDVQGDIEASGRDICNPACSQYADGTAYAFPDWPAGFNSSDTTTVPAACNYVIPVQSEAPAADQKVTNNSASSDPHCNPGVNPNCVCSTTVTHAGTTVNSCVLAAAPPKYDLDQLISILRPLATVLQEGPPGKAQNYYPQVGTSNLNCDASGCQGQGLELGGFPFIGPGQTNPDPVNGAGADPLITYVPGGLKCTSSCTGSGILIVDGDLELSASMAFYGTILVRGNVTVLGGGSPVTPCNIYGSLISQGGVNTDLGGGICFQYNSCAQRNASFFAPTLNLSFREMPQ